MGNILFFLLTVIPLFSVWAFILAIPSLACVLAVRKLLPRLWMHRYFRSATVCLVATTSVLLMVVFSGFPNLDYTPQPIADKLTELNVRRVSKYLHSPCTGADMLLNDQRARQESELRFRLKFLSELKVLSDSFIPFVLCPSMFIGLLFYSIDMKRLEALRS